MADVDLDPLDFVEGSQSQEQAPARSARRYWPATPEFPFSLNSGMFCVSRTQVKKLEDYTIVHV